MPQDVDVLRVEGLAVSYGGIPAVRDVSLSVAEGEIVALLGANGAGKTTTLKALMGQLASSARAIDFLGRDARAQSPERLVRSGMSLTPEGRHVFGQLTVAENLRLGRVGRRGRAGTLGDDDEILALFPILHQRQHQLAGTLSGGEQQQLAICRSLMSRPSLLLLDEPSLGVAPAIVDVIFDLIQTLSERGLTILLVEQNVSRSLMIADRGYVLEGGRIVHQGTAEELRKTEDGIVRTYLGLGEAMSV